MANGDSQTPSEEGGDDQVVDALNENGAKVNNSTDKVHPDESGAIGFIKSIAPEYAGHNGAHLRSLLLKNPDKLGEIATRIVKNSADGSERLANQYKEDAELFNEHKQSVISKLETMLSTDVLEGETTRESIVNRTYDLKTGDLSSARRPSYQKSPYDSIINREAKKHGLDPRLVKAVIQQESGFDPKAKSNKGAVGLMQLMPETAKELGVEDRTDPEQNLRGGIKYLADQIRDFDSVELGLAAFNAGPNRDSLKEGRVPEIKETKDYVQKITGNYQELIKPRMEFDLPISEYRDIALENKEKYRELGLINEEGEFKYDSDDGTKVFSNKLLNDEKLHKTLLSDRYDVFMGKLANSNNTGAIDENNPNDMARAWSVYDRFGSEGLTHFLNVKQHYDSSKPVEEQEASVQQGLDYIKNTEQGGFSVQSYISTFFGGEDTPVGKFEITPVTRSVEMREDVPKDLNNFTQYFDPSPQGESNPEAFKSFLGELDKKFLKKKKEEGLLSRVWNAIVNPLGQREGQLEDSSLLGIAPAAVNVEVNQEFQEEGVDRVYNELLAGHDTAFTRAAKLEILREAKSKDGAFSLQDLMKTIMANSEDHEELDDSSLYKINYDEANDRTKIAIDALRSDHHYGNMFHTAKDGNLIFEPSYYKRIQQSDQIRPLISMKWKKEAVKDKNGNVVGYTEVPGEQNTLESMAQFLGNTGYSIASFVDTFAVRPGAEWLFQGVDNIQNILGEEWGEQTESTMKRLYEKRWREHFDAPLTVQGGEQNDLGDWMSSTARFAVPFTASIAMMSKMGSAGIKAPWNVMKTFAKARSKATTQTAAQILAKKSDTFLGAVAKKMHQDAKIKGGVTNRLIKYSLGGIPLETLAGERWSLLGTGLADTGIEWALDQADVDAETDIQKVYRTSDRITQIGMDVLGYEVAGLLVDNLIGGLKYGVSQGARGLGKKSFRQLEFDYEKLDFVKGEKPIFSSDTRRSFNNLFNGLQDMPLGDLGESMASGYTGRAFLRNPESKQTLSDVVVGFSEEAHPIMSNAKRIIKDAVDYYDERLGGKFRLTDEQKQTRIDNIYEQFLDGVSRNFKETLEATGAGETAPLRIATLLERVPPSVKGSIPYTKDGVERHLMTLSEAEELASQSKNYFVKPARNGKFARVFEVDDGIWTSVLSERIRGLYKGNNVEESMLKAWDRAGVGRANSNLSQAEQQKKAEIEVAMRKVYGREVSIAGEDQGVTTSSLGVEDTKPSRPENVGVIIDADEDGFVVQTQEGTIRRGVDVDEFAEEQGILSNGKSGYTKENFENVEEGGKASSTGTRVNNLGDYLDTRVAGLYPNLTPQGRALISAADAGEAPQTVTEELRNIARANNVKATINDTPEDVIQRLRNKGQGKFISNMLNKALDAHDKSVRFVNGELSTKHIPASQADEIFQKSGLMSNFMKSINRYAKYAKENSGTARAIAKLLGVDNTDGYMTIGKNQTKITRFDPSKISKDGLKTNFVFLKTNNGIDEHFINVRSIDAQDSPSVWVRSESGKLIYNPKWRRIEPNVTTKEDGSLPLYTAVKMDGETWYRPAKGGEDGVFINVQKPTKNNRMSLEETRRAGVDAVERDIEGTTHYRLVNEQQQAIDPTLIKQHPSKVYNATTTVRKPKKEAVKEAKKVAKKKVQEQVREAGVSGPLAWGIAGGIVDNMFDTTFADLSGNVEEDGIHLGGIFSVVGAVLGSKYVRTKTIPTLAGAVDRSVTNLFDRDFSTLVQKERQVKEMKEMQRSGLYHDPLNKYDKNTWDKLKSSIRNLWGSGGKGWDALKQNEYVMSSLSVIKNIDHPTADAFFKALEGLTTTVNSIASAAPRKFAQRLQNIEGADESVLKALSGADPYTTYTRTIGPQKVKELFPEATTRSQPKEQFNLSVFRLMNSGAEMTEEGLKRDPTPNVARMYDNPIQGDAWNQLDEQLMQDPVFRAFIESHKNFFTRVMDRWQTQLTKRIDTTFGALSSADQKAIGEFLDSSMTFKQWKGGLSRKKEKIVTQLAKNENVKDLIGYHETKLKFTDLNRKYYPQIISETKTERAFKRYVAEQGLEGLSPDKQREQFDQHMADVMYKLNHNSDERKVLREYNADAKSYDVKYFSSPEQARIDLSKISANLRRTGDYVEQSRFIERNTDKFIDFKDFEVKKNGELVLDENGDPVTTRRYFLKNPDDSDINIFDIDVEGFSANKKAYRSFYDDITNNAFIRNSNFLERPRISHLPHEILETDVERVVRRYSSDVGKRIHNAENGMFDENELKVNYFDDVNKHLKANDYDQDYRKHVEGRMLNMYNIQNNIIDKSGRELKKERRFRSSVDLFKNALFSRFGFGFGWYNLFEWAVVGPHLTSGSQVYNTAKLFTTNKQALNNTERLLRTWSIVRKEIGSVNADFERYGILTESESLNAANSFLTKAANWVGDFSITKDLGGKVFGWDVRDWGMARLAADSFMGSNYVSTSLVAQSALGEARYIADVIKQLRNSGESIVRVDGKPWNMGDARRKLELLGIPQSEQDAFIQRSAKFGEAVEQIRGKKELDMGQFGQEEMSEHVLDVFHIMQRATENFHGTNKMYRPEGWNSPVGKALSTYSTYPFNFAMQTVNRRMKQPITEWQNKYANQFKSKTGTNTMKMLYHMKKGNIQGLRNMGLSDEAIESMPIDAYRGILKHIGSTLGVSTAGFLTMDAVNDLLAYPINDATGQEQWNRLRYRNVLNPSAPKEDQQTWEDIDNEFGLDSFMNISHYMLGALARGSFFGRYGDAIEQSERLSRDGVMSLTPLTGLTDQIFKDVFDVASEPLSAYPTTLTNKSTEFFLDNMPVMGSNVFGELRKGIYEQLKFKREKNGDPAIQYIDETTGEELDIDNFNTRLE